MQLSENALAQIAEAQRNARIKDNDSDSDDAVWDDNADDTTVAVVLKRSRAAASSQRGKKCVIAAVALPLSVSNFGN